MLQVRAHGMVERRNDSTSSRAGAWRGESAFTAWTRTFVSTTNIAVVHHLVERCAGVDGRQELPAVECGQGWKLVRCGALLRQCRADQVLGGARRGHAAAAGVGLELADHRVVEHQGRLHPYCRTSVTVLPSIWLEDVEGLSAVNSRPFARVLPRGGHPWTLTLAPARTAPRTSPGQRSGARTAGAGSPASICRTGTATIRNGRPRGWLRPWPTRSAGRAGSC